MHANAKGAGTPGCAASNSSSSIDSFHTSRATSPWSSPPATLEATLSSAITASCSSIARPVPSGERTMPA
ncbi:hypothetical protein [Cellulosimicrobium funkei]|uniref:hypothetical protein n=1 Tax=Cellulosimicrobium funkei TaxID=264251 RepID=UPI003C6CF225